jgi:ubiquitin C-terminal hydrolase
VQRAHKHRKRQYIFIDVHKLTSVLQCGICEESPTSHDNCQFIKCQMQLCDQTIDVNCAKNFKLKSGVQKAKGKLCTDCAVHISNNNVAIVKLAEKLNIRFRLPRGGTNNLSTFPPL